MMFIIAISFFQSGKAGDDYYGYNANLLNDVKNRFIKGGLDVLNTVFKKGLFENTLNATDWLMTTNDLVPRVAYAHLDGDWHSSTMHSLKVIVPYVVLGGVVVVDDYNDYSGCRLAIHEFWGIASIPAVVKKYNKQWDLSIKNNVLVINSLSA